MSRFPARSATRRRRRRRCRPRTATPTLGVPTADGPRRDCCTARIRRRATCARNWIAPGEANRPDCAKCRSTRRSHGRIPRRPNTGCARPWRMRTFGRASHAAMRTSMRPPQRWRRIMSAMVSVGLPTPWSCVPMAPSRHWSATTIGAWKSRASPRPPKSSRRERSRHRPCRRSIRPRFRHRRRPGSPGDRHPTVLRSTMPPTRDTRCSVRRSSRCPPAMANWDARATTPACGSRPA